MRHDSAGWSRLRWDSAGWSKALVAVIAGLGLALSAGGASAGRVLLDPAVEGEVAYRFAAGELARVGGLEVAFGAEGEEGDVVVGGVSPACRALVSAGRLALPEQIKPEGFAIRQLGGRTVVAGAEARGDLYGMLWLAERTQLDPRALRTLECVRAPDLAIREFNDGDGNLWPPGRGMEGWFQECLKRGVNTHGVGWMLEAVRQAALQPMTPGGRVPDGIENARKPFDEELRLAQAYHMNVFAVTSGFISMPVDDLIARYGDEVSESAGQLCPLKPKVWELYRSQLRAMLRVFPEIDFVRSTLSDMPADYRVYDCRGPACANLADEDALRMCLQATWDVVVGEFGKTYIVSTWGNPPEEYALNMPPTYRWIMDRLPDRGILVLMNSVQHDFYLMSPLNPVMGVGNRPQGVKFQVTREYEGQGFVPVYVGGHIRDHLGRLRETGLASAVEGRLWAGEGLWTRDVLWTRANMYALFRAAWEPEGDPWEWARDWAALSFGPEGAEELADALCLTEELARRTFWVHGYPGTKRGAYAITHRNCFTDGADYFRWAPMPHLGAYREAGMRGKLREALAVADEALVLRDKMMECWHKARARMAEGPMREAIDRDFEHFSALAEVLNPYESAMLLWCHTQDEGITTEERCWAAREAAEHARRTAEAYKRYRARFDRYRDSGMKAMLGIYLRDCAALSAAPEVVGLEPGRTGIVKVRAFNNAMPEGLSAKVGLRLPPGWSGGNEQQVSVAYGERSEVAFEVTPPARAAQGDAEIVAWLAPSGGEIEEAAIRAKVIELSGDIAAEGETRGPTTICPRAERAPTIDGKMTEGEWREAAPAWVCYPLVQDNSRGDNVHRVEARWMWDERWFYVAFEVADEQLQPVTRGSVSRGDGEGVALDLNGDRRDDFEVRFVQVPEGVIVWPLTMEGTLTSSGIAARAEVEPLGRGIEVAVGERPDGPGRMVEAAIPWSLLGGFRPEVGLVVGIALRCSDADSPGAARSFIQWPPTPADSEGNPTAFGDMVFVR